MPATIAIRALLAAALVTGGALAVAQPAMSPRPEAAPRFAIPKGYLEGATLPATFSPAPPAAGSASEARDAEASRAGLALHGGPRWELATRDADLMTPAATNAFSCAAGIAINPQNTPKLDALLRRTLGDLGASTAAVKQRYMRPRPFMTNNQPICTPDWEARLRADGSYPSGHSAIGYGWGLILAELMPEKAAALVMRGRAFGDSRRVCNVHWLSDIEEGRIAAAANVARLNADKAFQKDLAAVRKELRKPHAAPTGCEAEAAALALVP